MFGIVQKYERLRPSHVKTDRFFINFQKGKCTVQTIGKLKFYKMPARIASYLNLPESHLYTGNFVQLIIHKQIIHSTKNMQDIRFVGHQ